MAAFSVVMYGLNIQSKASGGFNAEVSTASTNGTRDKQFIIGLAYQHWASIGQKNVTAIMSQYYSHYEAAWFFINSSVPMGPTNGKYDCNIPRGPNNCNDFPESAWETLFNDSSWTTYSVCNLTVTIGLDQRASVQATILYLLSGGKGILKVPYEMDFINFNGTWVVERDWFGIAQNQATVLAGSFSPACET